VAHDAYPGDFLLLRSAGGAMSLRELTGVIAAGQQQPSVKVPHPYSPEMREHLERRLQVCGGGAGRPLFLFLGGGGGRAGCLRPGSRLVVLGRLCVAPGGV
jgi:hypothetical protein